MYKTTVAVVFGVFVVLYFPVTVLTRFFIFSKHAPEDPAPSGGTYEDLAAAISLGILVVLCFIVLVIFEG
jgi:hypothetical protein